MSKETQEFRRFVDWAGSQTKAAKLLDVTKSYVCELYHGRCAVPLRRAAMAERISGGHVRKELMVRWE